MQAVFDLVPQGGAAQAALGRLVELGAIVQSADTQAVDHVFINRLGEGIRPLENHADQSSQGDDFEGRIPKAASGQRNFPGVPHTVDQFVHPVEIAEEGCFPTAGWSDERGDLTLGNIEDNVVQGLVFPVEEVEVAHRDDGPPPGRRGRLLGGAWYGSGRVGHGSVFFAENELSGHVGRRDKENQHEGSGPSHFHLIFEGNGGKIVNEHGQRCRRLHQ